MGTNQTKSDRLAATLRCVEGRDGMDVEQMGVAIRQVAIRGAAEREARHSLAGAGELTATERAELDAAMPGGAARPRERLWLMHAIQALIE